MRRTIALSILLAIAGTSTLAAQERLDTRFRSATPEPTAPSPTAPDMQEEARSGSKILSTVAHLVGGAVVGGWLGYVGAQVVKSDWDKDNNSAFVDQRSSWVAGGMVIGVLGSQLVGRTTPPGNVLAPSTAPTRRGENIITRAEIEDAGVTNAYDLVTNLRHDWLITRGTNSWAESDRGEATVVGRQIVMDVEEGREQIIVYLDDIRLGGVEEMRDISVDMLMAVEFIDGRRATYRYGSGHAHGVILLSTDGD